MKRGDKVKDKWGEYFFIRENEHGTHYICGDKYNPNKELHMIRKDLVIK